MTDGDEFDRIARQSDLRDLAGRRPQTWTPSALVGILLALSLLDLPAGFVAWIMTGDWRWSLVGLAAAIAGFFGAAFLGMVRNPPE